jgi:hypothetical protein
LEASEDHQKDTLQPCAGGPEPFSRADNVRTSIVFAESWSQCLVVIVWLGFIYVLMLFVKSLFLNQHHPVEFSQVMEIFHICLFNTVNAGKSSQVKSNHMELTLHAH